MIEQKNLESIESVIIAKTQQAQDSLQKIESLKNEIAVLKDNVSTELKKAEQSTKELSAVITKQSSKITEALKSKVEQVTTDLNNESIDELSIAVQQLNKTIQNKKIFSVTNYFVNFLLMLLSVYTIFYLIRIQII